MMDAVLATIVADGWALIQLNIRSIKIYWFLHWFNESNKILQQQPRSEHAQGRPPLGLRCIIESTPLEGWAAPSPWWWCLLVVVLLRIDLWRYKLIVCKIWYKNNLKMRLTALLFDPPMRASYQQASSTTPTDGGGVPRAAVRRWQRGNKVNEDNNNSMTTT